MKKIIKIILMFLTIILSFIFIFNYLSLNINVWNWTFFLALGSTIITQFFLLSDFKVGKRFLFILLNLTLTLITALIMFMVPSYLFPYSEIVNVDIITSFLGILFIFFNYTISYTILTIFINRFKQAEKEKSSFTKLIIIYSLILTLVQTLVLSIINKA